MAISGSSASSVRLQIVNGRLHEGQTIHRGADVIEEDPQQAIKRLLAGETVNLWLHGYNLRDVRAAFAPSASPLEAAGWTSDCE